MSNEAGGHVVECHGMGTSCIWRGCLSYECLQFEALLGGSISHALVLSAGIRNHTE
jgi:hypothetical protein